MNIISIIIILDITLNKITSYNGNVIALLYVILVIFQLLKSNYHNSY